MNWLADIRRSYDTVASSYAGIVPESFAAQPYLRAALDAFAASVEGPVVDVGCGPGHVTARLRELGLTAYGLDLSEGMVAQARQPGFAVASMTDLPLAGASVGGVLAWWSLIHLPDTAIPGTLAEFRRVLRPGGRVQIGFHVGDEARLKTSGYGGLPMRLHVHRRRPERMAQWLREAGFTLEQQLLLDTDREVPGAILVAR